MKTKSILKTACLACVLTLTACNNEAEDIIESTSVASRATNEIVLSKNPIYTLGSQDANGIYATTPLEAISTSTWEATTEMDVTIVAPQAITLTGISARVNGEVVTFAEFQNADSENYIDLAKGEGGSISGSGIVSARQRELGYVHVIVQSGHPIVSGCYGKVAEIQGANGSGCNFATHTLFDDLCAGSVKADNEFTCGRKHGERKANTFSLCQVDVVF